MLNYNRSITLVIKLIITLKIKHLVYILILITNITAYCQECNEVLFKGRILDTLRPKAFYNLMVINQTTGLGVFGQPNGSFNVYANQGDSIALSIKGYPIINIVIRGNRDCQHEVFYFIEGKIQEFESVNVKPLKSLEEIKEERKALAMRETRMVTGIEVLQSPITALYQALSKKEKSKRWVANQEHLDNQKRILQELLRTYVAYEIIELSNDEFESFISFLNINEIFLKTASEMELITFIKDKFDHYRKIEIKR